MSPDAEAIARARARWRYRGDARPPFAHEPGPGQESVWDYPRPPRLETDGRQVRIEHSGLVIAQSMRAIRLLETAGPPTFYLPAADVRPEFLVPGRGQSHCEWKGVATYWTLEVRDQAVENVAWSYREPYADFERIRDHLAFHPARIACRVANERVLPQPGGFYGGWITCELTGPFKGEPGSEDW